MTHATLFLYITLLLLVTIPTDVTSEYNVGIVDICEQITTSRAAGDVYRLTEDELKRTLRDHKYLRPVVRRMNASATVLSDGYEFSCCPPCGEGLRLELRSDGNRNRDDYEWYAQPCDSRRIQNVDSQGGFDVLSDLPEPCPLYSYRGCWKAPVDIAGLVQKLRRQSSISSPSYTDRYHDYIETECALMARASNYTLFLIMDDECYGTNDLTVLGQGPISEDSVTDGCGSGRYTSSDRWSSEYNSMRVFIFPDCGEDDWNDYLSDIDVCVADGLVASRLDTANATCTNFNSSVISFSDFAAMAGSEDININPGVYWLIDADNKARCLNYSHQFLDVYECDNSTHSHLYYCRLPESTLVQWMTWNEWSRCSDGLQTRYRYRLNINSADRMDVESEDCNTSYFPTSPMGGYTTSVNKPKVEPTDSRTNLKFVSDSLAQMDSVSAEELLSALHTIHNLTFTGFTTDEAALTIDILNIIGDKLSVTSPHNAVSVIQSVSDTVGGLMSQSSVWGEKNNFASVLESVESIITQSAELLENDTSVRHANLDIVTSKLHSSDSNTSGCTINSFGGTSASVTLPAEVFTSSPKATLVAVLYRNAEDLCSRPQSKIQPPAVSGNDVLSSVSEIGEVVLSLTLSSIAHNDTLQSPISIQLPVEHESQPRSGDTKHTQEGTTFNMSRHCVFWHPEQELWLTDGCTTVSHIDHVTCHCTHLTSFAVLVQYTEYQTDDRTAEGKALTLIGQIGCAVSLLCLIITFSVFVYLDNLKTERKTIHMNLIVALGLAQITHVVGIDMTSDRTTCISIAVLLHLLYTATFTWMLCEGIQLYFKIIAVFDSESKAKHYVYYIIGWGTPLVVVGVSMAARLNKYGHDSYCWLSIETGLIWAFVGPVCAVVLINLCIMIVVIRIVIKSAKAINMSSKQHDTIALVKAGVKGVVILTPLLGINWMFGLLAVNRHLVVFEFLFVLLNSLQGLFIFLFHCVGSSEVRTAFRHKMDQSSKSVSRVQDFGSPDGIGSGGKSLGWIKGKLNIGRKDKSMSTGDMMSEAVGGNVGRNLGGLKHMVTYEGDNLSQCDESGVDNNSYDAGVGLESQPQIHSPPHSQHSNISNQFSIASTILTDLDDQSYCGVTDGSGTSSPPPRSSLSSARSRANSYNRTLREDSVLSIDSSLPGLIVDD